MTEKTLLKDDRDLFEMVRSGRELRRRAGLPEPEGEFDAHEATKAWHEMRQARPAQRRFYHVIIEPVDDAYRAYPLILPHIVAQGESPQAAKGQATEALRTYLKDLQARGQPLPDERQQVDIVEVAVA